MYGYQYDDLNRLLKGNYRKLGYGVTGNYDETLSYDKHGNIQTLQRNGFADADFGTSVEIDNLVYAYDGNKLLAVQDMSNSLNGFRDNVNNGNPDYGYDAYGNMTSDANKRIEDIDYNHLNLPTVINFQNNSGRIRYTYDALGVKLRKEVDDANGTTTTDYLDGFQYKNEVLSFFPTSEGYVEFKEPARFFYVYNYTDHLGNVRMSYTDNGTAVPKILEESHYYPFGLKHENYASERFEFIKEPHGTLYVIQPTERREWQYKYNGKEFQDELGLNFYDYGARNYDAAIGRWMNVDPLAEVSRRWNPYNYCYNNPVYFIDPDGMRAEASQTAPIYYDWEEGGYRTQDGDEVKAEDAIGAITGLTANVGAAAVDQSLGGASEWRPLTSDIFNNYVKEKYGVADNLLGDFAGKLFENAFVKFGEENFEDEDNFEGVQGRSTLSRPDAYSDGAHFNFSRLMWVRFNKSVWWEVKARSKNITLDKQIRGFINNLHDEFKYTAIRTGTAFLAIVTTSNSSINPEVYFYAKSRGVKIQHWKAQYKMVNGSMLIDFGYKNSPVTPTVYEFKNPVKI